MRLTLVSRWTAALAAIPLAACVAPTTEKYTEPQLLAGVEVEADVINTGHDIYMHNCYACHGEEGDGVGPASYGLWPPPRDFRKAIFKFAGVPEGELPSDEELIRVIQNGLTGTAMLPWDLTEDELWLTVQYIKTFSPEKKGFRHPRKKQTAPQVPPDPFHVEVPAPGEASEDEIKTKLAERDAKRAEAIELGEKNYHVGGCQLCHPSYVEAGQVQQWGGQLRATSPWDSEPKYSSKYEYVILPPDFLRHPVRSATVTRTERRGKDRDPNVIGRMYDLEYDVYAFARVISSGVPGTAMPSWAALPPEMVWSVAYYVADLTAKRDTAEGRTLRQRMLASPPAPPPPPPEPEPEPEPTDEAAAPADEAAAPADEAAAPADEAAAPAEEAAP